MYILPNSPVSLNGLVDLVNKMQSTMSRCNYDDGRDQIMSIANVNVHTPAG